MLTQRLEAQFLRARAPDVVTVARRLLALQGQDFNAVQWALALRTTGATRADVWAAFDAGALVRAWPLRGTLHVTAAEELAWLTSLTADRVRKRLETRQAQLGIEAGELRRAREVAERELEKHPLTRADFLAALERAKVSTVEQRGYHFILALALDQVLCWGPMRGREQALVLQARWLPKTPRLERDEALARVAARYLAGHGPAKAEDLAWWCGLTKGDAQRGLEAAGAATSGGLYLPPGHTPRAAHFGRREEVLLLPGFDEYFLGYADRAALIDAAHMDRVVPGGNGMFLPMIVERGRVVGTWMRVTRGKRVEVSLLPFTPPAPKVDLTAFMRFSDAA